MSCFLENRQPVLKSALLGTSTVWQPQAQSLAPWHEELIQWILVECKVLMRTGHFRLSQFHSFHDFTARENKDRGPRTDVERHFTVVSHQVSLTIQQRVAESRWSRLSRPKIREDTIVEQMNNHLPTIYPPCIDPPLTCPSLPSFPAPWQPCRCQDITPDPQLARLVGRLRKRPWIFTASTEESLGVSTCGNGAPQWY